VTVCSTCGAENPLGQKFCGECGARLVAPCPSCGTANPPGQRFCGECGTALEARAPAAGVSPGPSPAPPALRESSTAERRLVSVLFADLVGFTALSEGLDSEEVRDLLSRYFETARAVVERYGGTVEKFIGDAVMAVWGTPIANEDDAERTVRAALDLVEAVAELGAQLGAPGLQARAGVLTGEATVNLGAAGQGMVAGDLVNTASRIQAAAEPGTVLVGEGTRRATEAAVAYADAGAHELKGKAESVHLYRALRVTAGRRGLMKSEGLEPPFVGRDRELKMIKDLFHACVDEGKAHLVQVTGIAGHGKSRLGWEVFKYLDGIQQVFLWHRGRCLAYGEGVTYWALAEMVRGRAGILEGEDRTTAAPKLRETVERYVEGAEDRRFVEPRLAHLIGIEEGSASDKADLFAGWRLFFECLARENPIFMMFEDIQWADPSLLEFIDYLLEWSRSFPIFVMTLSRPGAAVSLSGAKRNATSIYLEPLPSAAMERLLTGLVPGLPAEVTEKILERAEGVPLYAVETVRMLLDRGLLVQDGPVYRPSAPIDDLEVPETLHALIAARLDGLVAAERSLVQDASVVGKTFSRQALAAVSGLPERELEPLLASLVAKEVLSVQTDPRSPERGQYGFLQDLVRTVAYETLAKRDRKAKHLRAASFLEEAWGEEEEEIVEVLASHYLEAYRLAPEADDAGAVKDRARRILARAGERAASLAAAEEALSYFRAAAELTDSSLERAELTERTGQMALTLGRSDDAGAAFEEATHLFEQTGQTHQAARVQARLADVEFIQGHLEQAIDRMRRAHTVLSGDEADPDLAFVAAQLGRFLAISGRSEEAVEALEEALELAEHLELPEVYSQALSSRAIGLNGRGRLNEAGTLLRHALQVALEHSFTAAAARAYNNLAVVLEAQDRFAEAIELEGQGLALARRTGDRIRELGWLSGGILDLVAIGRWDEAQAHADEVMRVPEISSLEWTAAPLTDLMPVFLHRGRLDQAREYLQSLPVQGTENPETRASYGLATTRLLRAEGNAADALTAATECLGQMELFGLTHTVIKRVLVEAVEAALELGDITKAEELLGVVQRARPGQVTPYLRAHAARLAARLAAVRSEVESVEPAFLAATQGFRDLGTPFDLGLTLLEHGEWLVAQGRGADAELPLAEARELFARLEATPWLERAHSVAVARTGEVTERV
jgi:class 3 adenylate cyclase/tetratricopeptide (TPR) repeat protein